MNPVFCMVCRIGKFPSAAASSGSNEFIALMPTKTAVNEIEKPITSKNVVGLHARFNLYSTNITSFFMICFYDDPSVISLQKAKLLMYKVHQHF